MEKRLPILTGRGSADNPANRFERLHVEDDFDQLDEADAADLAAARLRPPTVYLRDTSRTIIASNDSPDVGFTHSINPYRGCAHGCCYCYARPTHEWLGFSAGLDFETKIMVKRDAPELLRQALSCTTYQPVALSMSGVTDCYQPGERQFRITRGCLEVLAEFRNPVGIITKNHLVTRDVDLLADLAADGAAAVFVSITTLDAGLAMRMEPRASAPRRRLDAIRTLAKAGIPTGVLIAPVVPGLTDHEMPSILKAAVDAGAGCAGYTTLRLPYAVAGLFEDWLSDHFPDRKEKVLNRIRSLRGGKLNDSNFGSRMRGEGLWAEQFRAMFKMAKRAAGLGAEFPPLSTARFRRPGQSQMTLW